MKRVWALAAAYVISLFAVLLMGPLGGPQTLLTAGVPIGAGITVATVGGGGYLMRAFWMFAGFLFGLMSYGAGALAMPDTPLGLAIGGSIPVVLLALFTMWTRRQSYFVAGLLGIAAITGVFAVRFNTDPQGLNTAMPIAIGQTVLPMGIGYLMGMVAAVLTSDDDTYFAARAQGKQKLGSEAEATAERQLGAEA